MILFESLRATAEEQRSFLLERPETVLECHELAEVAALLRAVEKRVAEGYTAVGFLTYEAGFAFLPGMPPVRPSKFPLAWFALTREVAPLDPLRLPGSFVEAQDESISDLSLNLTPEEYVDAVEIIRRWIERGYTYQVNFTMRYQGFFIGSPRALYRRLRNKQRADYAAYIETEDWAVVSLSPELFFRKQGNEIVVKPMKGTAPRGRTNEEDALHIKELQESAKEKSENLMIVDMLRNDLGRICEIGSIEVTDPMRVDKYETLLQMTTTVRGKLKPQVGLAELFGAAFPCGSVTGAPKVRTMQIIHELERSPRGIYTGAIGVVTPDQAVFNVAIRTALIDRLEHRVEMGVGSGVLHEANPQSEYRECVLKGRFLTDESPEFRLLETILWTRESGFSRLELHLARLSDAASYFLYELDLGRVKSMLAGAEKTLRGKKEREWRVRLLAAKDGAVELEVHELEPLPAVVRIRYGGVVDSSDPFLYHKTTRRARYDQELDKARKEGYFDVLFCNEKGEVTEGAASNVFALIGGAYCTPPVSCGLLPGTYRKHLMENHPFPIEERVLFPEDLARADAVFCSNSLRGLIKVEIQS